MEKEKNNAYKYGVIEFSKRITGLFLLYTYFLYTGKPITVYNLPITKFIAIIFWYEVAAFIGNTIVATIDSIKTK